jgi:hypothetical protein
MFSPLLRAFVATLLSLFADFGLMTELVNLGRLNIPILLGKPVGTNAQEITRARYQVNNKDAQSSLPTPNNQTSQPLQ